MPTATGAVPVASAIRRRSRSARGTRPVEQRLQAGGRQQPVEGAEVLLGERLGRNQQRRLRAGLDRLADRKRGDDRLAGADLALKAPHRALAVQVAADLARRAAARP